jgi:hypothetical protein
MESVFIAVGLLSLLAIVTLRQNLAGTAGMDAASHDTVGRSLVAVHDWTFLLGPGWVVGVGNGLLGYLMYRSGPVPRGMAMLGLIGSPLIILSGIAVLFDVIEPGSSAQVIATIPEFFWGCHSASTSWSKDSSRLRSPTDYPPRLRCDPRRPGVARVLQGGGLGCWRG